MFLTIVPGQVLNKTIQRAFSVNFTLNVSVIVFTFTRHNL